METGKPLHENGTGTATQQVPAQPVQTQTNQQPTQPQSPKQQSPQANTPPDGNLKKRPKRWVWFLLAFIVLLIGLAGYYFF